MAGTLPTLITCCTPCADPEVVQIPGPQGDTGDAGADGTDGQNAFTTFTAQFVMPAADGLSSAVATVENSDWLALNQVVYAAKGDGSVTGWLRVVAIDNATTISLLNLEDTATGAYDENSAPGSIFTVGSKLCPGGLQGIEGPEATGAAGGDLKGNYPDPKLSKPNALGDIIVGNGTDAQALSRGTDGYMFVSDAALPLDVGYKALLPITNALNLNIADNRIGRLDGATGLPIPIQGSYMTLTDTGALQGFFQIADVNADAKGTDAVDLQPAHTAVTQVASGANSVLVGGSSNTASAANSLVVGGAINVASGISSSVLGGSSNTAAGVGSVIGGGGQNAINSAATRSVIAGGRQNDIGASGEKSFIGAGEDNLADALEAVVVGGNGNTASGDQSVIGGGLSNTASGDQSAIGGGDSNVASGQGTTIAGGTSNSATAADAVVGGGDSNDSTGVGSVITGGLGNDASGTSSTVGGGASNEATADFTTVAGGTGNIASSGAATVSGGAGNLASGPYATVPGGISAIASHHAEVAHASGAFAVEGDAQTMEFVLMKATTNATPGEMWLDNISLRMTIPADAAWAFHIHTMAKDDGGAGALAAAWETKGAIYNRAGTTALVAAVTQAVLGDTSGGWTHVVSADNTNDALIITVTGAALTNIRWVSHVRVVQVFFG